MTMNDICEIFYDYDGQVITVVEDEVTIENE